MRLLFDATTTLTWADRPPVGTVRVERLVLADLCRHVPPDDLAFVKFRHGAFVPVTDAQRRLITGVAEGSHRGATERPAKPPASLAGQARRWLKASLRRRRSRADADPARFAGFTDFLTLGHGWDYLDHAALRRMREANGLRVHAFVHDLIAVDHPHLFHDPANAGKLRRHHAELCRLADVLIVNSNATRAALERFIAEQRLPRPRVHVAQLPVFLEARDGPCPPMPAELGADPFVLYVSTIEPRKNHGMLLRLWSECARDGQPLPKLVLVGRLGWGFEETCGMLRRDPALRGRVLMLGEVTDDLLAALYRRCMFAVYPSVAEGWGLPIAEAMSFGKACLHADDPAQHEASQGLAPARRADDPDGWKGAILALANNGGMRALMEEKVRVGFRPRTPDEFCREVRVALGMTKN